MPMNMRIAFSETRHLLGEGLEILENLEKKGFSSFLVGGAVRDILLHRPLRDLDIVTSAPRQILERLYPRGKILGRPAYPVYLLPLSSGGAGEIVALNASSLEENLSRRDFTINSLAMDYRGEIRGSSKAFGDLHNRILRWNGSPEEKLRQDPLRALRLCRFGVSLKGFRFAPETLEACPPFGTACANLPGERIGLELYRGLGEKNPVFSRFLHQAGLLQPLCRKHLPLRSTPEFHLFFEACRRDLSFFCCTAAFFLDILEPGKDTSSRKNETPCFTLLRHWCWPEKEALAISRLLQMYEDTKSQLLLRKEPHFPEPFDLSQRESLLALLSLDPEKHSFLEAWERKALLRDARLLSASRKGLFLSGKECMELLECSPGPALGSLLRNMERKILETPDLSKEDLHHWLFEEARKIFRGKNS